MEGIQSLTEKEKQTLRMIVRGHDAKSLARHLGLSVHTINERLRDARRKLEVSSSREAARRLMAVERHVPEFRGDQLLGDAGDAPGMEGRAASGSVMRRSFRLTELIAGAVLMIAFLTVLALTSAAPPATYPAEPAASSGSAAVVESDAVRAARHFLELGDQARWADGYAATGASFHQLNTLELWSETAQKVRLPLGRIVSRTVLGQESVPAPPSGVEVVKFRSSFANKADVIETVSLAREGSNWVIVGIYLD